MDISVGDLGPVGVMKTGVNTAIVMATVGVVLSRPDEFNSAGALGALAVGLLFVCGVVEWVFRGWHKDYATKISDSNDKLRESGVLHLPYARQRMTVAEIDLAEHGRAIVNNNGHLSVEIFEGAQLEEIRHRLRDPNHDPTRNPFIADDSSPIVRPRK